MQAPGEATTRCGEPGEVDNMAPTCEPCLIVSGLWSGSTVVGLADHHSMPEDLVETVLESCARRRGWEPSGLIEVVPDA